MSNNHCNCNNRVKRRRCGCMKMARGGWQNWQNFPYYSGPCPDLNGCYGYWGGCGRPWQGHCDCDCDDNCQYEEKCEAWEPEAVRNGYAGNGCRPRCRCRNRGDQCNIMLASYLPTAISANGLIPLVMCNPCRNSMFDVNSGLVTLEKGGTYLATYTLRTPEAAAIDTTITLNVNDASQSSAVTQVAAEGSYSAQAIFQANEGDTVALRSSAPINITDTSTQPLFTLSLVQLNEE